MDVSLSQLPQLQKLGSDIARIIDDGVERVDSERVAAGFRPLSEQIWDAIYNKDVASLDLH